MFTPALSQLQTEAELLGRFGVDHIATEALLFQTGYAVEEPMTGYWFYTLGYPNLEVETSLNQALLPVLGVQPPLRSGSRCFVPCKRTTCQASKPTSRRFMPICHTTGTATTL